MGSQKSEHLDEILQYSFMKTEAQDGLDSVTAQEMCERMRLPFRYLLYCGIAQVIQADLAKEREHQLTTAHAEKCPI